MDIDIIKKLIKDKSKVTVALLNGRNYTGHVFVINSNIIKMREAEGKERFVTFEPSQVSEIITKKEGQENAN